MQYASGNWYEGGWACDQKNGRGVMCWPTPGETYDGDWVDGKPHGVGTHAWDRVLSDTTDALTNTWFNTRNSYRGQFAAGMRQGYGRVRLRQRFNLRRELVRGPKARRRRVHV